MKLFRILALAVCLNVPLAHAGWEDAVVGTTKGVDVISTILTVGLVTVVAVEGACEHIECSLTKTSEGNYQGAAEEGLYSMAYFYVGYEFMTHALVSGNKFLN